MKRVSLSMVDSLKGLTIIFYKNNYKNTEALIWCDIFLKTTKKLSMKTFQMKA